MAIDSSYFKQLIVDAIKIIGKNQYYFFIISFFLVCSKIFATIPEEVIRSASIDKPDDINFQDNLVYLQYIIRLSLIYLFSHSFLILFLVHFIFLGKKLNYQNFISNIVTKYPKMLFAVTVKSALLFVMGMFLMVPFIYTNISILAILGIAPVIYKYYQYILTEYHIIFQNISVLKALDESKKSTEGKKTYLIMFDILSMILGFVFFMIMSKMPFANLKLAVISAVGSITTIIFYYVAFRLMNKNK